MYAIRQFISREGYSWIPLEHTQADIRQPSDNRCPADMHLICNADIRICIWWGALRTSLSGNGDSDLNQISVVDWVITVAVEYSNILLWTWEVMPQQ